MRVLKRTNYPFNYLLFRNPVVVDQPSSLHVVAMSKEIAFQCNRRMEIFLKSTAKNNYHDEPFELH